MAAEEIENASVKLECLYALDFRSCRIQHDCVLAGDSQCPGKRIWRLTMKRSAILFGSVAVGALLIFFYFYGGSTVPNGQRPLVRLTSSNIKSLRDAFNGSANSVRLLVLVSPT